VAFAGTAGLLPFVEERPVTGDAVGALGNQCFRLIDKLLLPRFSVAVDGIEFREERAPILFDRRLGGPESLPQIVSFTFGKLRPLLLVGLPLSKQGVDLLGCRFPLCFCGILCRELLSLDDDGRPSCDGFCNSSLGLFDLVFGEFADS
jgi:hypothetical protein